MADVLQLSVRANAKQAKAEIKQFAGVLGELNSVIKTGAALGVGFGSGLELGRMAVQKLRQAAAAAIGALADTVRLTAELGDQTAKMARNVGIASDSLQVYQFAAGRSGVETSNLNNGLKRLGRNAFDAANGNAQMAGTLEALGIELKDADGRMRSVEDLFRDMADVSALLGESVEGVGVRMLLLGRSGAEMGNLMAGGSQGLDAMQKRLEDLNAIMSDELLLATEEYQDAMLDLNTAIQGLRNRLGEEFIPQVTALVKLTAEVVARSDEWVDVLGDIYAGVKAALTVLTPFGGALDAIELSLLGFKAAAAAAAQAVDDIPPDIPFTRSDREIEEMRQRAAAAEEMRKARERANAQAAADAAARRARIADIQAEREQVSQLVGFLDLMNTELGEGASILGQVTSMRIVDPAAFEELREQATGIQEHFRAMNMSAQAAVQAQANAMLATMQQAKTEGILTATDYAIARIEIERWAQDEITRIHEEEVEKRKDKEEEWANAVMSITRSAADGVTQTHTILTDLIISQLDQQTAEGKRAAMAAFIVNKAVALGNAIVQTALGITQALGSTAPPASYALAAATGIAGGVAIAQIAATTIAGVADAGMTPEQVAQAASRNHTAIVVKRGEMVMDSRGTSELTRMLQERREGAVQSRRGGGTMRVVNDRPIYLDGREVGRMQDDYLISREERGLGYGDRVRTRA